jgi:hypothetical protein
VIEAWCVRTAGELALNCLAKAHELGVGWHFRWPPPLSEPGRSWWSQEELEQSRLPESMAGFTGGFSDDGFSGHSRHNGLYSASFRLEIA